MATPIRTSIAVLLAGGLAAATLPVALAAANAATTAAPAVTSTTASTASHLAMKKKKPKLTLSDTTLRKGDKVKLTVKRLPKRTTS
ncbi:MAG TPA: hypothetical protein VFN19_10855, partial [Candidatus Nanopelagicales bacterium]|nr:hypothetical protein [Candidatus Nanopelagicales bacterium]